jgi:hypothetical protein
LKKLFTKRTGGVAQDAGPEFKSQYRKTNKQKNPQINNLIVHLKLLERQKQAKLQISKWKAIIEIRAKWAGRVAQAVRSPT